ncbi:dual specificity protein phosphatase family protein [Pseudomonas sp. NPDC007930]|uniref:phosphatase domain-containing protein n=1 Tax=Pseudomonas sp. NPDC007930 TaxID=3364417 RepID=UPI0036EBB65B
MQGIAIAHRRRLPLAIAAVLLLAALAGAGLATLRHHPHAAAPVASAAVPAPAHLQWAKPVDASFNLFQMSPTLYRSALPAAQNASTVDGLGVRTVISFIKDDDHDWAKNPHLQLLSQPMHADRVTDDEILQALRSVRAAEAQGPVLMHCKHGNNRTGIVAALYRIVLQGWSRQQALDEMLQNGFGSEDDMTEAMAYVRHADTAAISQALASGAPCAHNWSMCSVKSHLGML